jgi:hypothetical protein
LSDLLVSLPAISLNPLVCKKVFALSKRVGAVWVAGLDGEKKPIISPFCKRGGNNISVCLQQR